MLKRLLDWQTLFHSSVKIVYVKMVQSTFNVLVNRFTTNKAKIQLIISCSQIAWIRRYCDVMHCNFMWLTIWSELYFVCLVTLDESSQCFTNTCRCFRLLPKFPSVISTIKTTSNLRITSWTEQAFVLKNIVKHLESCLE